MIKSPFKNDYYGGTVPPLVEGVSSGGGFGCLAGVFGTAAATVSNVAFATSPHHVRVALAAIPVGLAIDLAAWGVQKFVTGDAKKSTVGSIMNTVGFVGGLAGAWFGANAVADHWVPERDKTHASAQATVKPPIDTSVIVVPKAKPASAP